MASRRRATRMHPGGERRRPHAPRAVACGPRRTIRGAVSIAVVMAAASQPARATDADAVDAAIERGVAALLRSVSEYDEIDYRLRESFPAKNEHVRGHVKRQTRDELVIETDEGRTVTIPRSAVIQWSRPGHVQPERPRPFFGGPSALAALALLSADVEAEGTGLGRLLDGMADDDTEGMGTYVRSLRSAAWSALLQRPLTQTARLRYTNLLRKEMAWLRSAMQEGGGYGYGGTDNPAQRQWDNSNTQFAHLGLWAGAIVDREVSKRYWLRMAQHWMETQDPSGGWGYSRDSGSPTSSMTVAGCNSLYIVLDRYYARTDRRYRLFEGAAPRKRARDRMRELNEAIARGDAFLTEHPPSPHAFAGYELFGIERLGLASGRAFLGGRDWYRRHVDTVAGRAWGDNPEADAFALIFLTHGRAPILFQKLAWSDDPEQWNYYHRDLSGLTRYLSQVYERLHRWQIVPREAGLQDLDDAPFLYVSGSGELALSDALGRTIRRYVENGGTVFVHADRADEAFARSAEAVFEAMFEDRGLAFAALPKRHPLYRCQFGRKTFPWTQHVPLRALSDGSRILVYVSHVDLAGAWHQDQRSFEDLFRIMANVRTYSAPPFSDLPRRLRRPLRTAPPAVQRGSVTLARLRHRGPWNTHMTAWQRAAPLLRHETGVDVHIANPVSARDADIPDSIDVLHVSVRGPLTFEDDESSALRRFIRRGGLVVIDAADGQPRGIGAVLPVVDQIDAGQREILTANHPIVSGGMAGGAALLDLRTTPAGASLRKGNLPPPIFTRTIDGRVAVLGCPFDLTAGLDGVFIWNRVGYQPSDTRRLVGNVLLWTIAERSRRGEPAAGGSTSP